MDTTTATTPTAAVTDADRAELLDLPRRNAHRIIGMLQDALSPDGLNFDDWCSTRYPTLDTEHTVTRTAWRAGFVVSSAALGPRGGQRTVIRERVTPEYRAGLAAVVDHLGTYAADAALAHPEMLASLSDTPELVTLAGGTGGGAHPAKVIEELAALLPALS